MSYDHRLHELYAGGKGEIILRCTIRGYYGSIFAFLDAGFI